MKQSNDDNSSDSRKSILKLVMFINTNRNETTSSQDTQLQTRVSLREDRVSREKGLRFALPTSVSRKITHFSVASRLRAHSVYNTDGDKLVEPFLHRVFFRSTPQSLRESRGDVFLAGKIYRASRLCGERKFVFNHGLRLVICASVLPAGNVI